MFLAIRNPGIADHRSFTLIGASTTRNAGHSGTIGQFGSGSKLAMALLLREGIEPVIACGTLKMEFSAKSELIRGQTFNRVCVKYSGTDSISGKTKNSTEDLGFSLEWGVQDWTKVNMAFREFVANAIDGAIANGGSYKDVIIEEVEQPRAKNGYTSVFLPMTADIKNCFQQIGRTFLHFSQDNNLNSRFLKKFSEKRVLIYKNGVLTCSMPYESIFDYNFGNELTLDESRNATEWDVKYAISRLLEKATHEELKALFEGLSKNPNAYEHKLSLDYISCKVENIKKAWDEVFGVKAVAVSPTIADSGFIEKKGLRSVVMPEAWRNFVEKHGVLTEKTALNRNELEGKTVSDPTSDHLKSVDWCWNLLNSFGLTNGKEKPKAMSFRAIMSGGSQTNGYYIPGGDTVYLHQDLVMGKALNKVTLEEVTHYVTGADDGSRDIQDFLFRMISEIAS